MATSETKQAPKSKLPILVGAIGFPVLVYSTISWLLNTGGSPAGLDALGFLIIFVVPAALGGGVGLLSRRIAKTEGLAILFTLIGLVLLGVICVIGFLVYLVWSAYRTI